METTGKIKMLYLVSGRSAASQNIGRKISEIVKLFGRMACVTLVCGGDIPGGVGSSPSASGPGAIAEYHAKWYRKNALLNFFTRSFSELKDLYHNFRTYRYLSNRRDEWGLVWERSSRLHWAGLLYARRHSLPCVLEWKDNLIAYRHSLFRPLALYVERWKNRRADFIVVESAVLKEALVREGVDGRKIIVARNAVDPASFEKDEVGGRAVREELGYAPGDFVVGYAGSYAFYHDAIRIVEAADVLKRQDVSDVRWLLIGDGKDKQACERLARERGLLGSTVTMLPFQPKEKVPRFLSAMDVTLLPGSTDIICPIKVMEYMAARSVVLVPDYECNREVITDGQNGLLFKPFDERSLAEKVMLARNDRKLCRRLGENARRTICEAFTWDKTYGSALRIILEKIKQ